MLFRLEKKSLLSFLLVFSCSALSVVTGQLNCHDLNISGEPVLGSHLPYCQLHHDTLQCCTPHYLMTLKENITTDLTIGMQKDLQSSVLQHWMNAYSNLTATIDEILVIFLDIFPFPHNLTSTGSYFLNTVVKTTLTHQLHPNFTVDSNFNFSGYITNFTTVLIDLFTMSIPYSLAQQQCLNGLLQDHINISAVEITGSNLRHIQNIFQSLHKTRNLLINLTTSLANYTFSEQCVTATISQYCSHCIRNIPSLCENICAPIVTGCSSPVHDGLLPQLDALWNVSRQLVKQTQFLMNCSIQFNTHNILPPSSINSLIMLSQDKCQVDLFSLLTNNHRKKRFVDNIRIPQHLQSAVNLISSIKGIFNYGTTSSIPHFCSSRVTSANCWNGNSVVSNGSLYGDLPVSIEDQLNNPVYNFDVRLLYQEAIELGTPVAFLFGSSDFLSTLPMGILIPNITHLTPPPFSSPSSPSPISTTVTPSTTTSVIRNVPTKTIILPTIILIYPSASSSLYVPNHLTIALIYLCPLLILIISNWYQ